VPFAIGLNKVYFCRPPLAQHYGEAVRATCADLFLRRAAFLGAPVDIYKDGRNRLQARVAATPLWLAIRTTPLAGMPLDLGNDAAWLSARASTADRTSKAAPASASRGCADSRDGPVGGSGRSDDGAVSGGHAEH
jgi:hypothetical protein